MNTTKLISKKAKTKSIKNEIQSSQRNGNSMALNGQYKIIRKQTHIELAKRWVHFVPWLNVRPQ